MIVSRLDSFLDHSLIEETLKKVENGEEVDFPQLLTRQALQTARIGELYVLELIQRERAADNGEPI